jgi:hypothetical protein
MDEKNIPYKKDEIGIEEINILKDLIRNNIDDKYKKSVILSYIKATYNNLSNSISFNVYTDENDLIHKEIVEGIANSLIDIELIKEVYNISDSMIKDCYKNALSKRKHKLEKTVEVFKKKKMKKGKKK